MWMQQRTARLGLAAWLLIAFVLGGCAPSPQTAATRPIATAPLVRAATSAPAATPTPAATRAANKTETDGAATPAPTATRAANAAETSSVAAVTSSGREIVYAIQPGTAQRQAAGERVAMFPPEIRLTLGSQDILVIRNDDSVAVSIDGLLLDPGQKATQKYFTTGTFSLVCSTDYHNERVKIVVEGPAK